MRGNGGRRLAVAGVVTLALGVGACSKSTSPLDLHLPGDRAPVRMVFLSERPPSPPFTSDMYLFDLSRGGPARIVPNVNTASTEGPCGLSGDGTKLAFFTNRLLIGSPAVILIDDLRSGEITVPRWVNTLNFPQNPSLSRDGRYLAVQYQVSGPFDLYIAIQDMTGDSLLPLPSLNEPNAATFDPSLTADGQLIAFSSNRFASMGGYDIFLYSVPGDSVMTLPGLNSTAQELSPSISADGRYITFQSGRTTNNTGIIDVYLYDRATQSLVPLPGANSELADFQPAISPDGRYIAFATESSGGRDVKVYDVRDRRLLSLPGLNHPYFFDYFPALAEAH